jgi:putative glycosyltransferase (TIGR04348 family)
MARIVIVTPARPGTRSGNRHTATRWAAMLRSAGHRVSVALAWEGEPCDALIALHARRSHASARAFREAHPGKPLVVALTGTDLYKDLPGSPEARASLALADRLIVLQEAALGELASAARRKARVVYQSSDTALPHAPPTRRFRIAVVGHLREEKDPFRTVAAVSQGIPGKGIEIVQIGEALTEAMKSEAETWMAREPRYRWVGSVAHPRALQWIAKSHLLVVSSVMEGGANVIAEAARIGTPVLASKVSGNVGMLGRRYPGLFPLHDEKALAALIHKAMRHPSYTQHLKAALRQRRSLFAPAEERRSLLGALKDLL